MRFLLFLAALASGFVGTAMAQEQQPISYCQSQAQGKSGAEFAQAIVTCLTANPPHEPFCLSGARCRYVCIPRGSVCPVSGEPVK